MMVIGRLFKIQALPTLCLSVQSGSSGFTDDDDTSGTVCKHPVLHRRCGIEEQSQVQSPVARNKRRRRKHIDITFDESIDDPERIFGGKPDQVIVSCAASHHPVTSQHMGCWWVGGGLPRLSIAHAALVIDTPRPRRDGMRGGKTPVFALTWTVEAR